MKRTVAIAALAALLLVGRASAQAERIFTRPWCDLEPFVRVGVDEYPLSRETAAKRILEEGRLLFSSMVYGYTFSYIPSDAARKVSEAFVLAPVAEIPWGSKEVDIVETTAEDKRLYARLSYTLSGSEELRRRSWDSSAVAMSSGTGEGNLFAGYTDKFKALDAAIEDAIKNYIHTRVLNKPREVKGEVVLWEDPRTIERAGAYITSATVRMRITEIVPYRIF